MRGGDAWTDKQDKINRLRRERYHSDPAFKKRLLANSKRWRDKKKGSEISYLQYYMLERENG